ncbi:uncharacterized protein [Palaemon carinicauda]|uniref:uncharacterized protein n=1 Tax=Palaemon carinicauda TaxID=392227 RepID=UPI0035B605F7
MELDSDTTDRIKAWAKKLSQTSGISVLRSLKVIPWESATLVQLHLFSDASIMALGVVAYLQVWDSWGNVSCRFIMGKSRVAPLKHVSMPRLELGAAVLAVRLGSTILTMIDFRVDGVYHWTDSTTVLRYIRNDQARYQTFVANRVSMIRESSDQKEWKYVNSEWNQADDATRSKQSDRLRKGPEFLVKEECFWPTEPDQMSDGVEGLEVKHEIGPTGTRGYQIISYRIWLDIRQTDASGVAGHMEMLSSSYWTISVESGKPPFLSYRGGPFRAILCKARQSIDEALGVIFTCLNMRALHLEVASNLTSDTFISAFKRFLARCGQVKTVRCDCGSNIVGSRRVLDSSYEFLAGNKVRNELLRCGVEFIFNPLGTSHFGGACEQLIGTVRRVLDIVLWTQHLDYEGLCTLFCDVEATVNSGLLTVVISDSRDPVPLTPNKLLNMGDSPVGCDIAIGSHSKQRWKQVHHMAEQFWACWKREYLLGLQQRQKWFKERRNVRVGDVVFMVKEIEACCHWPLARVVQTELGKDSMVRTVTVRREGKEYDRLLSKLVLILEEERDLVGVTEQ